MSKEIITLTKINKWQNFFGYVYEEISLAGGDCQLCNFCVTGAQGQSRCTLFNQTVSERCALCKQMIGEVL